MAKPLRVKAESRKRYYRKDKKCPPLPSLSSTVDNSPFSDYFLAYLEFEHIYVVHKDDADRLYQMGFFGKGSLSRGPLDYDSYQHSSARDNGTGLKVLSRRRYYKHQSWKKSGKVFKLGNVDALVKTATGLRGFCSTASSTPLEHLLVHTIAVVGTADPNVSPVTQLQHHSAVTVDDIVNYVVPDTKHEIDPWENATGDTDFWGGAEGVTMDTCITVSSSGIDGEQEQSGDMESASNHEFSIARNEDEDVSFLESGNPLQKSSDNSRRQRRTRLFSGSALQKDSTPLDHHPEIQKETPTKIMEKLQVSDENEPSDSESPGSDQSDTDSEGGDTLVLDDSLTENDSDSDAARPSGKSRRWRTCLKRDPYPVKEKLHLSREEAFFLTYGLGCLVVKDISTGDNLNISQLWNIFRTSDPAFVPRYIAYHYYRSKGWVLKNGLKYGADFVLYRRGPTFFHSSFSILIKSVVEPDHGNDPCFPARTTSWLSLACVDRVIDTVAKEVLYCYVVRPSDLTVEDLCSPECIPRFKVCEMHLKRWVSKEQRDETAAS